MVKSGGTQRRRREYTDGPPGDPTTRQGDQGLRSPGCGGGGGGEAGQHPDSPLGAGGPGLKRAQLEWKADLGQLEKGVRCPEEGLACSRTLRVWGLPGTHFSSAQAQEGQSLGARMHTHIHTPPTETLFLLLHEGAE